MIPTMIRFAHARHRQAGEDCLIRIPSVALAAGTGNCLRAVKLLVPGFHEASRENYWSPTEVLVGLRSRDAAAEVTACMVHLEIGDGVSCRGAQSRGGQKSVEYLMRGGDGAHRSRKSHKASLRWQL